MHQKYHDIDLGDTIDYTKNQLKSVEDDMMKQLLIDMGVTVSTIDVENEFPMPSMFNHRNHFTHNLNSTATIEVHNSNRFLMNLTDHLIDCRKQYVIRRE